MEGRRGTRRWRGRSPCYFEMRGPACEYQQRTRTREQRTHLDKSVRNVSRHPHTSKLHLAEVLLAKVRSLVGEERIEKTLKDDGVGEVGSGSNGGGVGRDRVEDAPRTVQVLGDAAPGVDERRPVRARDGDGGVGEEAVEDVRHGLGVGVADRSVRVEEELVRVSGRLDSGLEHLVVEVEGAFAGRLRLGVELDHRVVGRDSRDRKSVV